MTTRLTDRRFTWLIVGVLAGMCLSYFWPHEPALAIATDRGAKFALATAPVTVDTEAVFVLNFLTGRLQGHVLNAKVGKFAHAYFRNVNADFEIPTDIEPSYAIVANHVALSSTGPDSLAQGVVYVAEMNTGMCVAYGYPYNETNRILPPVPMVPLDTFRFQAPEQRP